MADTAKPTKSKQGTLMAALTRKLGPAPAWAWLGAFAVAVYWYRNRQGGTASSTAAAGGVDLGTLADLGYTAVPSSDLGTGSGGGGGGNTTPTPSVGTGSPLSAGQLSLLQKAAQRLAAQRTAEARLRQLLARSRPKRRKPQPRATAPTRTRTVTRPKVVAVHQQQPPVSHPRATAPSARKQRTPVRAHPSSGGGGRKTRKAV